MKNKESIAQIKNMLIDGIVCNKFDRDFADQLHDNADALAEFISETITENATIKFRRSDPEFKDGSVKVTLKADVTVGYKTKLEDAKVYIELQKEEIARQIIMCKSTLRKGIALGFFACIGLIYIIKGSSLLINLIF